MPTEPHVLGSIYLPHPAASQGLDDSIVRYCLADHPICPCAIVNKSQWVRKPRSSLTVADPSTQKNVRETARPVPRTMVVAASILLLAHERIRRSRHHGHCHWLLKLKVQPRLRRNFYLLAFCRSLINSSARSSNSGANPRPFAAP